MALQTNTTIKIGQTSITNFNNLKIIQKIHDHHTFSFEIRQDLFVEEFKSVMPFSQQLYGEKISIEVKPIPGLDDLMVMQNPNDYIMQFYGVVTKVKLQKSRIKDMEETILITGHSSSIILDNGPESNSFTRMPLNDIVSSVKSGYDIDMDIRPFYTQNLPYTVQYNTSSFKFLNQLARRYGHWFYDNGRRMVFGFPGSTGGEPNLVYGVNMQDFEYEMKLVPSLFKVLENDNRQGGFTADETLKYRKEIDGFHQNFLNKSNGFFNKETIIQLNQNPVGGSGNSSLEEYAKNKMRSVMSKMMQIKASSEVPGITLGNLVRINGVDMQLESSYRVTQITHLCDDGGSYENHFKAVNFNGSVFSPKTNPDLVPKCKSQTAIVTANADPDGLSGVQVQMPWQTASGQTTPYIPMVQKYGGDTRGSHVLPEIGDTVFVDFQGGNAELPIVTGTMTSNTEKSGFSTPNNDLKVFRTRSGNKAIFNDETGDVTIESEKGQTLAVLYGDGNVKVKAPKNIEFEAGEDVVITAGKNIKMEAQENIEADAGTNIIQEAGNDINIMARGNINEFGDNKTESIKENYTRSSHESTQFAEEVTIISSKENMLLESSQKTVEINSAEDSNIF